MKTNLHVNVHIQNVCIYNVRNNTSFDIFIIIVYVLTNPRIRPRRMVAMAKII